MIVDFLIGLAIGGGIGVALAVGLIIFAFAAWSASGSH